MEKQQLEVLGLTGIDSRWHDNSSWVTSIWGAITMNRGPELPNVMEFAIFWRDYIIGQSHWTGALSAAVPNQGLDKSAGASAQFGLER
ncbi:hypothetical protein [Pseudomonas sp. QD4]|uniref:hypothetical protein n=1 Tax=Pseudomonas sp. QD4 TaxID=3368618 RepID=UPI003BA01EAC